ncbi:MAG: DUF1854 domain-containing protein [Moraxellaceae bacterium]|nr:DUF1854 domain-containing protein [Moraxellaceae bacterium]
MTNTIDSIDFTLARNELGQLVLTDAAGTAHTNVVPVRAFPIAAPDEGISLLNAEGHEVAWIDRLPALPDALRELVQHALAEREFMPEIQRLHEVSSFATPSTWQVSTDRGEASFVLKGEEDIRRLAGSMLLIADHHGVQYLIRDLKALDRHSRRLLDRFL